MDIVELSEPLFAEVARLRSRVQTGSEPIGDPGADRLERISRVFDAMEKDAAEDTVLAAEYRVVERALVEFAQSVLRPPGRALPEIGVFSTRGAAGGVADGAAFFALLDETLGARAAPDAREAKRLEVLGLCLALGFDDVREEDPDRVRELVRAIRKRLSARAASSPDGGVAGEAAGRVETRDPQPHPARVALCVGLALGAILVAILAGSILLFAVSTSELGADLRALGSLDPLRSERPRGSPAPAAMLPGAEGRRER